MHLVGDLHGKTRLYNNVLNTVGSETTVILGDVGFGFWATMMTLRYVKNTLSIWEITA